MKAKKVFIAGVMQGNRRDGLIHAQDYRNKITDILYSVDSSIKIIDPDKTDPDRLNYSKDQSSRMFFKYCNIVSTVDMIIAYVPHASMGSAIEMWIGYNAGIPILSVTPLKHNWVIKLLSSKVYSSIAKLSNDKNYIKSLLNE